jgi:hypothetical protein
MPEEDNLRSDAWRVYVWYYLMKGQAVTSVPPNVRNC